MSEFFVVFFSSRVRCTFSAWWCLVMAILVSDLFVLHRCCYPSSCWVQQQGAEVPSPGASNSLERSRLCDAKRCKEQCPARRITSARYISASTRSNVAVLYSSYWIAATSLRRRSSQWFGADGLKMSEALQSKGANPKTLPATTLFFRRFFIIWRRSEEVRRDWQELCYGSATGCRFPHIHPLCSFEATWRLRDAARLEGVNWHNVWVWMINAKIGSFGIRVTALAGEMQQGEVQNPASTSPHDA